ncbi:MAG: hypothetical protein HFH13_07400 [Dorea sp.]|jgi:hypothetical protein|nr:hypothetical protein [Dorea sp.]
MNKKTNTAGVAAMQDEGYSLPIENEKKLQKTEFAWWSAPTIIIFLTVSMSALDALVLYDIMDQVMTQSEIMGKIVSFGIALILNMMPLLIAKFTHQAMYRLKRGAAVWAVAVTAAFFVLFASTVWLRFAYQEQYGESASNHLTNELQVEEIVDTSTESNPKGLAVVLLLSIEPLVTSLVNFGLAYIGNDELRERINHLRIRRLELSECESDLKAYLATTEPAELRRGQLLALDMERKKAAEDEIHARCDILKARARTYLAEYLKDPEGASYVTASLDEKIEKVSQESQTPESGQMTKLTARPITAA